MKLFTLIALLAPVLVFADSFHFHEGTDGKRHCYRYDNNNQVIANAAPYGSQFCAEVYGFVWSADKDDRYDCFAVDKEAHPLIDTDPVHPWHCTSAFQRGTNAQGRIGCYPAVPKTGVIQNGNYYGEFLPGAYPVEDYFCRYVELYPGFWIEGGPV